MGILFTTSHERKRSAKRKARGVFIDHVRFENQRQAELFMELQAQERAGTISNLRPHVRLPLIVNGIRVDTYTALFSYERDGERVLVDVVGWQTDLRKLQRRLVHAIYGIKVTET